MLAELYVLTGRDAGKGITADAGPTIFLGRAATNHIRVRDPAASRVHCRIDVGPDGLVLHDNGSGNGTFVNGARIKGSRQLADEDEVQLGETRVKVLLETDSDRKRWRRVSTLELVETELEDSLLDSRSSGDGIAPRSAVPDGEVEDELELPDDGGEDEDEAGAGEGDEDACEATAEADAPAATEGTVAEGSRPLLDPPPALLPRRAGGGEEKRRSGSARPAAPIEPAPRATPSSPRSAAPASEPAPRATPSSPRIAPPPAAGADAKTTAKADAKADARTDARTDSKGDAKAESKNYTKSARADAKGDARTDARTEARTDAKGDARADSKGDLRADVRTEPKGDLRADARTESKGDLRADARTESKGDPRTESRGDARTESRGDARTESRTDAGTESKGAARTESRTDAGTESKGDPRTDARTDARARATDTPRAASRAARPPSNDDEPVDDLDESGKRAPGRLREVLPGYRIEARLGGHSRAGMAVYRAHQVSLDRTVALKVLLAKGATSQRQVDRLVREARAIARLPHPNIVTIHDIVARGALRVLVMEHVGGGSLADRLEDGPLPLERLLAVAEHVARALSYAHAHGVVHRNVKPSNVLYAPEVEAYKLCDFGHATEQGAEAHLGRAGETSFLDGPVDSLPFVAPELLCAEPRGDARSDVYALGATLYACAAGMPPFSGPSAPLVATQVLRDEPAPLRALPEPLWTVIARCLRKAPAERYPDGAALRHEVEACRAVASGWGRIG